MWVELRDRMDDWWLLEVIRRHEGARQPVFGDLIEATRDGARAAAAARLQLAGHRVVGWTEVEGGWDGQLG